MVAHHFPWEEQYLEALAEQDREQRVIKVAKAQQAIFRRMTEPQGSLTVEELRAIEEALLKLLSAS
jgi:hypothetical protein